MSTPLTAPQWTSQPANEGATAILKVNLVDPDGEAVPGSALDAVTFTLYDEVSGAIINNRQDEDLTNHVDENGLLTIELTPSDQVVLDDALSFEYHRALIRYSWTLAGSPATQRASSLDARVIVRAINYLPNVGSP